MTKKDFWWLLCGIALAFALQILYDGLGDYLEPTPKFLCGIAIAIVLIIALLGVRFFSEILRRP